MAITFNYKKCGAKYCGFLSNIKNKVLSTLACYLVDILYAIFGNPILCGR